MKPLRWRNGARMLLGWGLAAAMLGLVLLALTAASGGATAALPAPAATTVVSLVASGQATWQVDGAPLCTADWNQVRPEITSDGEQGAIVIWQDYRHVASLYANLADIYAQRVYSDGTPAWLTDGVRLSARPGWPSRLISDGAGGAITAWSDGDVYAQRVYSDGRLAWRTGGMTVCAASGAQWWADLTGDGAGGAVVVWEDYRAGLDIYAQRVYSNGSLAWGTGGTLAWLTGGISVCAAPGDQAAPQVASDGAGGAIVTWSDWRSGNADIYVQRMLPDSRMAWGQGGSPVCQAPGDQLFPEVMNDGNGGAIVVWQDSRNGNVDLYAQRVYPDGAVAWATDGVSLCTAAGDQRYPVLVGDGEGGAIMVWQDERSGWNAPDVYAQRVYSNGAMAWAADGLVIAEDARYSHWHPDLTSDGAGGAIITWEGPSGFGPHVYAQRVRADGTLAWKTSGVPVCTTVYAQLSPRIVEDGAGGAIVVWEDNRRWYKTDEIDIYAQRVMEVAHRFYLPLVLRNT